jgi:hypothetical protein
MKNTWIVDVIEDLRRFADCNGFPGISEKLEEASLVAALELAIETPESARDAVGHERDSRTVYRPYAAGKNA